MATLNRVNIRADTQSRGGRGLAQEREQGQRKNWIVQIREAGQNASMCNERHHT